MQVTGQAVQRGHLGRFWRDLCILALLVMGMTVASFLLFRVFDIGKWFPMKQLERLPGGLGIVADDVAAGLLARLCLLPWA